VERTASRTFGLITQRAGEIVEVLERDTPELLEGFELFVGAGDLDDEPDAAEERGRTDLAAWVMGLAPSHLPPAPFRLRPGIIVLGVEVFLARLQSDLALGDRSPRNRFGAVDEDVRHLADLLGVSTCSTR
jgi:hypothetical protein